MLAKAIDPPSVVAQRIDAVADCINSLSAHVASLVRRIDL